MGSRIRLHGCPRCKVGDVSIDRDQYGWFESCLQCGYIRDLPDVVSPRLSEHADALVKVAVPVPQRKLERVVKGA
ncbi:MAG: hypothetical protein A2Z15_01400 [Chloroflexi bacterium RBG_16_50_11]|nr:MAG: hypothetical protein A2Z15_01400 [Chloroflexi bacterium RBG_16_50_11]